MPVEISAYFIALSIFGGVTDYWAIVRSRLSIMRTSPQWLDIVNSSPGLWCDLMVSPRVHVDCLGDHLHRSGSRDLRIHISFRLDELNRYIARTFDALSTSSLLDRRLALIIGHAPRWVALRVETDRRSVMHFLWNLFSRVLAPAVRHLSLVYFFESHVGDILGPVLAPVTWFDLQIPLLEVLTLRSASMAWMSMASLSNLRCLFLFDIPNKYHPTFIQFKYLIECSPLLEQLALRDVGCSDILLVSQPSSITSRSIRIFDVDFKSDATMGLLCTFFRFPNLERVVLLVASSTDILSSIGCSPLFAAACYLELSGCMVASVSHSSVFKMFQGLTCLDLSGSGIAVFIQLVKVSAENLLDGVTTVMPALHTLALAVRAPFLDSGVCGVAWRHRCFYGWPYDSALRADCLSLRLGLHDCG
ncbi:hypothetical protein B0H11DRAFT_2241179 [Mycena galericulata]|nr:hypothetical protein B0H11DRAFT_2241179 [Mycena galericulata]